MYKVTSQPLACTETTPSGMYQNDPPGMYQNDPPVKSCTKTDPMCRNVPKRRVPDETICPGKFFYPKDISWLPLPGWL